MAALHLGHGGATTHQDMVETVVVYTEKHQLELVVKEKKTIWIMLSLSIVYDCTFLLK